MRGRGRLARRGAEIERWGRTMDEAWDAVHYREPACRLLVLNLAGGSRVRPLPPPRPLRLLPPATTDTA